MNILVRKLSSKGDTPTLVEGDKEVVATLAELLALPHHLVAVEGEVVKTVDEALARIGALAEAEVILARQVAGG